MKTRELKEECDRVADIVDVVGRVLELRPKGREFVCLCPFHDDHKPSMFVVPAKQIYSCFSCGASGDVYDFVKRYHGLSDFRDVVAKLAEMIGVQGDGRVVKEGQREKREAVRPAPPALMTPREILEEWRWYKANAFAPDPWAGRLGIDPAAMEITGMVAAPFRHNPARKVLVAPMRDAEGTLCSLRFRDFETKKRWCLDVKEKVDGELVPVKGTMAGLMSYEAAWDPDVCLEGVIDHVIEGETDLLGLVTILLRSYPRDPMEWPVRILAIPGVMSCHDMLLGMRLAPTLLTFFDLDGAGFRAAFDHRPTRRRMADGKPVLDEDGHPIFDVDMEAPHQPGLIRRLQERGVKARACFPPRSGDGKKYDLRDMARDGWDYARLYEHELGHSTADPRGRRVRRVMT